jgi:lysophospholipase L1-like esterase
LQNFESIKNITQDDRSAFMRQISGAWFATITLTLIGISALAQPAPQAAPEASNSNSIAAAIPAPPRPNSAVIPRLAPQYMRKYTNNVEIAKQGNIDVLFMGDSITDFWRNTGGRAGTNGAIPMSGKAVFDQYFGAMKVANFGIAGDTTQGVLWRLQHGEGEGYKPRAIMLMIGTNNTGNNSAPEIAMGIADIVFEMRKDFPEAKILLLAIFPRDAATSPSRLKIQEINRIISALHDNQHVFFMDIGSKFLAEDGSIPADIMSDRLHPTSKGYTIWAEAVRGTLASMLQ